MITAATCGGDAAIADKNKGLAYRELRTYPRKIQKIFIRKWRRAEGRLWRLSLEGFDEGIKRAFFRKAVGLPQPVRRETSTAADLLVIELCVGRCLIKPQIINVLAASYTEQNRGERQKGCGFTNVSCLFRATSWALAICRGAKAPSALITKRPLFIIQVSLLLPKSRQSA